jgi:hypothetical protein
MERVNSKMNLKEIGCKNVDWIHLVQDRGGQCRALVNTVLDFQVS